MGETHFLALRCTVEFRFLVTFHSGRKDSANRMRTLFQPRGRELRINLDDGESLRERTSVSAINDDKLEIQTVTHELCRKVERIEENFPEKFAMKFMGASSPIPHSSRSIIRKALL